MAKKLLYSPEFDRIAVKAAEEVLGGPILGCTKMTEGEVNHVYRIDTEDRPVILRAFGNESWPKDGALFSVQQTLADHGIEHPKILHYSRDNAHFPYGFMMMECVTGKVASCAIGAEISFEEFCKKLGALLAQVHKIRFPGYGGVGGQETFTDFAEFVIADAGHSLRGARLVEMFDFDVREAIGEMVDRILRPYSDRFQPTLVHFDAGPENCILTPDGELVLIDWDNAASHTWIQDHAVLTYWHRKEPQRVRDLFLESHGLGNFTIEEVEEIERALHALFAVKLLSYYYYNKKDRFLKTKSRLLALLR